MSPPAWDDRIKRAEELAEKYTFARDLLNFYREILLYQKNVYTYLSQTVGGGDIDRSGACPLHDGSINLHLPLLLTFFPSFLSLIKEVGPQELSQLADKLSSSARQEEWGSLLESYWRKELNAEDFQEGIAVLFFPKAFLQPYAEFLAENHTKEFAGYSEEWHVAQGGNAHCPLCGSRPQLGVLRTEGEGAKRLLLCSLCATEWHYKRVCCPACGEERFAKLSCHKASDFPHVRVEVCESCHKYIKGIDLTVNGLAIPVVDEIATLPLDLWAAEQGYNKVEMNLVGV